MYCRYTSAPRHRKKFVLAKLWKEELRALESIVQGGESLPFCHLVFRGRSPREVGDGEGGGSSRLARRLSVSHRGIHMLVPYVLPVLRSGAIARIGPSANQPLAGSPRVTARVEGPGGASNEVSLHRNEGSRSSSGVSNLLFDFTPPVLPAGRYQLVMRVGQEASPKVVSVPFVIE
jgi:hypothetical protein